MNGPKEDRSQHHPEPSRADTVQNAQSRSHDWPRSGDSRVMVREQDRWARRNEILAVVHFNRRGRAVVFLPQTTSNVPRIETIGKQVTGNGTEKVDQNIHADIPLAWANGVGRIHCRSEHCLKWKYQFRQRLVQEISEARRESS